jgi:hypothetical protein
MSLTGVELDVIENLAWPLPAASRRPFINAVVAALQAYPVHGVGLAHRIGVELQRSFFTPPKPSSPQHLNDRKLRSVARSTGISSHVRRDAR